MNLPEPTLVRLRRFRFDAKVVLQISLGILLLGAGFVILSSRITTVHSQAQKDTCQKVDTLGRSFIDFIDSTVNRSTLALKATEASPTATVDQKRTAARNLVGLKIVQADAHNKVKPLHCTDIGITSITTVTN